MLLSSAFAGKYVKFVCDKCCLKYQSSRTERDRCWPVIMVITAAIRTNNPELIDIVEKHYGVLTSPGPAMYADDYEKIYQIPYNCVMECARLNICMLPPYDFDRLFSVHYCYAKVTGMRPRRDKSNSLINSLFNPSSITLVQSSPPSIIIESDYIGHWIVYNGQKTSYIATKLVCKLANLWLDSCKISQNVLAPPAITCKDIANIEQEAKENRTIYASLFRKTPAADRQKQLTQHIIRRRNKFCTLSSPWLARNELRCVELAQESLLAEETSIINNLPILIIECFLLKDSQIRDLAINGKK